MLRAPLPSPIPRDPSETTELAQMGLGDYVEPLTILLEGVHEWGVPRMVQNWQKVGKPKFTSMLCFALSCYWTRMHGVVATASLRWEQLANDPSEAPQRYLLSLHKDCSFSPCLNTYMLGLVRLGWAEMGWTRRRQWLGLGLGQRPGLGLGQWASGMVRANWSMCLSKRTKHLGGGLRRTRGHSPMPG